jgi:hypothetical protein
VCGGEYISVVIWERLETHLSQDLIRTGPIPASFVHPSRKGCPKMPNNGEISQSFGIYKAVCCGTQIVLNAGARFPDCPRHPKLSTIWKLVRAKRSVLKNQASELGSASLPHVGNRRLFNMVTGKLTPEAWEHEHLSGCRVCQGVVLVFINQIRNGNVQSSPKRGDAA